MINKKLKKYIKYLYKLLNKDSRFIINEEYKFKSKLKYLYLQSLINIEKCDEKKNDLDLTYLLYNDKTNIYKKKYKDLLNENKTNIYKKKYEDLLNEDKNIYKLTENDYIKIIELIDLFKKENKENYEFYQKIKNILDKN